MSKSDLAGKCPYAFGLRYVDKVPSKSGTHAKIGIAGHRVAELVLKGDKPKEALAQSLAEYDDLTSKEQDKVTALLPAITTFYAKVQDFKHKQGVVDEFLEQQWAVDAQFNAVDWNSPDAFFRGIVDHALLTDKGYLIVIDHKTGRRRPVDYYARQLDAYAVLAVAQMPELKGVQGALHYVGAEAIDWYVMRKREVIDGVLRSSLVELLQRRAAGLGAYEPNPNYLCKWCDYLEKCDAGNEYVQLTKKKKKK